MGQTAPLNTRRHQKPPLFYGWYIVLIAFLANTMSGGIGGYVFGLFIKPMTLEFGWGRTAISAVFLVRTLTMALSAPIIGAMLDRKHGARLMMTLGGTVGALGLISLSFTNSLLYFYIGFGVVWGIGMTVLGSELVTPTIVSKWFVEKRGRAIAISAMGISLGGAVLVPSTSFMIDSIGWRETWTALGLLSFFVTVPLSLLLVRRSPEDLGLLPDGLASEHKMNSPETKSSEATFTEKSWTLNEAVKQPALWIVLGCFSLSSMAFGGLFIHLFPYVTDKGYSPAIAGAVLTIIGVVAGFIKPAWGFLAEKIPVRYAVVACFLIVAASLGILITTDQGPLILFFPFLYAVGAGGLLPLMSITWANYFGRNFLGTIRGVFAPVTFAANGLSPVFSAYIYDVTNSYDLAYSTFVIFLLVGALGMLMARPPQSNE